MNSADELTKLRNLSVRTRYADHRHPGIVRCRQRAPGLCFNRIVRVEQNITEYVLETRPTIQID